MSSAEAIEPAHRTLLLDVAAESIRCGLRAGAPLLVDPGDYPHPLRAWRATFVTLRRGGALRACMGHLEATEPLVSDVSRAAFLSAFEDPRFSPVAEQELAEIEVEISILGPLRELAAATEADLLRRLRPGVDGLVLIERSRRSAYLPAVWSQLSEPAEFVAELKCKAGLPRDYWSPELRFRRFAVETLRREAGLDRISARRGATTSSGS